MPPIYLLFSFITIFVFGCYTNPRTSVDDLGINIPEKWSMPIHETSDNNKDWVTAFDDKELTSYLEAVKVKALIFFLFWKMKK